MILTRPQFEVLSFLAEGADLLEDHKGARIQPEAGGETIVVSSATVRALYKHGLIEPRGPLTDFPRRFKITEKGEAELSNRKPPSKPPQSKLKICPHYKAAILSSHDFGHRLKKPAIDALAEAIQEYGRCDGAACEHAVIKRERNEGETQTKFIRCGRRYDEPSKRNRGKKTV